MQRKNILFICTHNSARSQMAEGYLRHKYGDRYEAYSAGTQATRVHPEAISVMKEIGVDISDQRSKVLVEFFNNDIDMVVTVCDSAHAVCPIFPGAKKTLHQSFTDPSAVTGTPERIHQAFQKSRDEIAEWIDSVLIPASLEIEHSK